MTNIHSLHGIHSKSSLSQIKSWFERAVPTPTHQNIHTQIACHLEEFCEMLTALADAGSTFPAREEMGFAHNVIDFIQRRLKAGDGLEIEVNDLNRVEVLDALCDQIVTAIGIAHMLEMDIQGALQEVADSNDSKFTADGQPIFNAQHKIVKGPRYFPPDLSKFT